METDSDSELSDGGSDDDRGFNTSAIEKGINGGDDGGGGRRATTLEARSQTAGVTASAASAQDPMGGTSHTSTQGSGREYDEELTPAQKEQRERLREYQKVRPKEGRHKVWTLG